MRSLDASLLAGKGWRLAALMGALVLNGMPTVASGVPSVSVATLPAPRSRWALIVGVENYDDASITPLVGPSKDGQALSDALVTYAGFEPSNVVLLSSEQKADPLKPTRMNILLKLREILRKMPSDGLLLLAFSGHGVERSGSAFLIASDSRLGDDVENLQDSAVPVQTIKDAISKKGLKQVIVLLDACRDDPVVSKSLTDNTRTPAFSKAFDFSAQNRSIEAFAILYATQMNKRSYISPALHQSYFSAAVVEGISGGAADEDGDVKLGPLVDYLQKEVPKRIENELQHEQKPDLSLVRGYLQSRLIIAHVARPGVAPGPSTETSAGNRSSDSALQGKGAGISLTAKLTCKLEKQNARNLLFRLTPHDGDVAAARLDKLTVSGAVAAVSVDGSPLNAEILVPLKRLPSEAVSVLAQSAVLGNCYQFMEAALQPDPVFRTVWKSKDSSGAAYKQEFGHLTENRHGRQDIVASGEDVLADTRGRIYQVDYVCDGKPCGWSYNPDGGYSPAVEIGTDGKRFRWSRKWDGDPVLEKYVAYFEVPEQECVQNCEVPIVESPGKWDDRGYPETRLEEADWDADGIPDFQRLIGNSGGYRLAVNLSAAHTVLLSDRLDPGYTESRTWVDVDGDGSKDYCRVVGDKQNQGIACNMTKMPFGWGPELRVMNIDWGYVETREWKPGSNGSPGQFCRGVGKDRNAPLRQCLTLGRGVWSSQ